MQYVVAIKNNELEKENHIEKLNVVKKIYNEVTSVDHNENRGINSKSRLLM